MKKPKKISLAATEGLHEKIAELAYRSFVERGYQHGHDLDDWLHAERQLTEAMEMEPRRPTAVLAVR